VHTFISYLPGREALIVTSLKHLVIALLILPDLTWAQTKDEPRVIRAKLRRWL
jgi:hypothetical protein